MAPRAIALALTLAACGEAPPPPAPPVRTSVVRPAPAAPAAPAPAPDLSGLRLHGLLATGAILGFADGGQRLVGIGREALPGLVLVRIEQQQAVFGSAGAELRLGFDGAAAPAGVTPVTPVAPAASASGEESLRYRLALVPRRGGGRVTGFTVRPGAQLPALAQAGILPGDTIVGVNGAGFDEERMQELGWTIANSTRTEFDVERGRRRLRLVLQGR